MDLDDMKAIWANQNELLGEAVNVDSDQLDNLYTS